jgi:hypothetical protein
MTAVANQFGQWFVGAYTQFAGATENANSLRNRTADERIEFPHWPQWEKSQFVEQRPGAPTGPPTVVDYYVDTASTSGGDGTTPALSGANRAFVSLSAALTALQTTNWKGAYQRPLIHCAASTGAADTTVVSFASAWNGKLSPTCYLTVVTDQPSSLFTDTSKYRLAISIGSSTPVSPANAWYVRLVGIHVLVTIDATAGGTALMATSEPASNPGDMDVRWDSCRLSVVSIAATRPSPPAGFWTMLSGVGNKVLWVNCVVSGLTGVTAGSCNAFQANGSVTAQVYAYDCTVYNSDVGIYNEPATAVVTAKNFGAVAVADGFLGNFAAASTNNASNLAADAPGSNARNSVTPTFVNAAGGNLHLDTSDTAWSNVGADLSADPVFPFSTDGDGETRTGTWDVGADENVTVSGAGASALPMLTGSAAGTVNVTGAAADALPSLALASAGAVAVTGSSAVSVPVLTLSATGAVAVTGTAAATLPMLAEAAAGVNEHFASGAVTLPMPTEAAAGVVAVAGSSAASVPMLTGAAAGAVTVTGSSALTLPILTLAATGTNEHLAVGAVGLPMLTGSSAGVVAVSASASLSLPMLTLASDGSVAVAAAGAVTAPMLTVSGTGAETVVGAASTRSRA